VLEEEIHPLRRGIMFENKRWSVLMFGKLLNTKNARMDHPIQELELSFRGLLPFYP
jgi:hypothetical protein